MMRLIVAVVAGYVIMVIGSIIGFLITWGVLGAEGAFQENSTVASLPWILVTLVFSMAAAVAGGWGASRIGNHPSNLPPTILAGAVFLVGLVLAVMQLGQSPPPLPEGTQISNLGFFEAGQYAASPTWVSFLLPPLGAAGALAGGSLARKRRK